MTETSDVIATGAAAIALLALGVSIYEAVSNRPRLRVTHYVGFGVGGLDGDWLGISVINWGRQPTTIASVGIEFPGFVGNDGQLRHAVHMPSEFGDAAPKLLEVGREAKFLFRLDIEVANITTQSGSLGSMRDLIGRYGAIARVSSTWHSKPIRKRLKINIS